MKIRRRGNVKTIENVSRSKKLKKLEVDNVYKITEDYNHSKNVKFL